MVVIPLYQKLSLIIRPYLVAVEPSGQSSSQMLTARIAQSKSHSHDLCSERFLGISLCFDPLKTCSMQVMEGFSSVLDLVGSGAKEEIGVALCINIVKEVLGTGPDPSCESPALGVAI